MLPLGAQGANQAIEDAGALGALFSGVESTTQVLRRLELFEAVRRLRASRVQTLSRVRLGRESDVEDELRKYADPLGSGMWSASLHLISLGCRTSWLISWADVPNSFAERYKHDYGYAGRWLDSETSECMLISLGTTCTLRAERS